MIECPHCNYKVGTQYFEGEIVRHDAVKGEFFIGGSMHQNRPEYYSNKVVSLLGCPNCRKTFLGDT